MAVDSEQFAAHRRSDYQRQEATARFLRSGEPLDRGGTAHELSGALWERIRRAEAGEPPLPERGRLPWV